MLNQQEIRKLIQRHKLIEGCIDLETQLTSNGFDLTCASIAQFSQRGALDFSSKERIIPACKDLLPKKSKPQDKFGWWLLKQGTYKVKTNETVNLPHNLVAMAFSRTSLLRMGGFTQHGVWDAGFCGKGEFILSVENPLGIKLKQNARIAQLVFLQINKTSSPYRGIFHNLK